MNMQALINNKLFVQTSAKALRRGSQGLVVKQSARQYATLFQRASVTKSSQLKHENTRKTTIISPFGSHFNTTFRFYVNEEFKKKDREAEEQAKKKDEEEAEEFREYQQKQKEKEDMKRKIEQEIDDDDKKAFDKLRKIPSN
jgi:transketolase